jgi:ribosomal protein S18 acetylase RimI-like enzyme
MDACTGERASSLPEGELVRSGTTRDVVTLSWMVEVSSWVYWPTGQESLRELLTRETSLIWLRNEAIRAALIYSLYRQPVATMHVLVLREEMDLPPFFSRVLGVMEGQMTHQCVRWVSFFQCEPWLTEGLWACGYRVRDRVIDYHKRGLQATLTGNREVPVRPAMPVDHAALLALDAQCFEPFWQLNAEIVRCAIATSAYALVAEIDGELVGYLMAEHYSDQEAYVSRVGVLPSARGQGIGTRLLVQAMQLMARDGLRGVRLNTQEDNVQSRTVYERLGFDVAGAAQPVWAKALHGIDQ